MSATQSLKTLSDFCITLANGLVAGTDILNMLQVLETQYTSKIQAQKARQLRQHMEQGDSFLAAFSKLLPPYIPFQLANLTEPPDLKVLLTQLAHYFQHKAENLKEIIDKLKYPLILLLSSSVLGLAFILFLLPMYMQLFQDMGVEIPRTLVILNIVLNGISQNQIWIWSIIAILFWLPSSLKQIQRTFYRMVFPIYPTDITFAIGLLLQAGYPLKTALDFIQLAPESQQARAFNGFMTELIRTGQFGISFSNHFNLDPLTRHQLEAAEKTGTLSETLVEISEILSKKEQAQLQKKIQFIQPICLLAVAILVIGFVSVSMLPIVQSLSTLL